MDDLVERAKRFATQGHQRIDEARKSTGKPYDAHLKAVAALVASVSDDPVLIAAAWLHDVVEDTPATLDDVERQFGAPVAALVHELTDVSRPGPGGPAARLAVRLRHFAKASPAGQSVKLADLIETCHTVCKHTPDLAPAWLHEMSELLAVLQDGDARLLRRARALVGQSAERFGIAPPPPVSARPVPEADELSRYLVSKRARLVNTFTRHFTANGIAEPLRSFDDVRRAAEIGALMAREELEVAGVRRDGAVFGYLRADRGATGTCGDAAVAFKGDQIVSEDAPLADVIEVLTRYDYCFVAPHGEISAVIRRADMLKPAVRMWLFGIVTLLEQEFSGKIGALWPREAWRPLLSQSRLAQAEQLRAERLRRGQSCCLLDCLQLSDKAQILLSDPANFAVFGLKTKSAVQRIMGDIESLRNNLAHAQDIVTHDWPQIIRIARRIESLAGAGSAAALGDDSR